MVVSRKVELLNLAGYGPERRKFDRTTCATIKRLPDNPRGVSSPARSMRPGYLGQSRTNPGTGTIARYPLSVLDYRPLHRAALINLDRWITEDIDPPPSRHPRLSDATAVERKEVLATLARLPGLTPPDPQRLPFVRTVEMGSDEATGIGRYPAQEGAFYPALVSAVDADGNETAGIRMPDITVPVGTHAGWNPRDPVTGSPEQIVPMNGLTLWFAPDEATRAARGDPRRSLAERYRDEADYGTKVRAAALRLAAERYLSRGGRGAGRRGGHRRAIGLRFLGSSGKRGLGISRAASARAQLRPGGPGRCRQLAARFASAILLPT